MVWCGVVWCGVVWCGVYVSLESGGVANKTELKRYSEMVLRIFTNKCVNGTNTRRSKVLEMDLAVTYISRINYTHPMKRTL